MEITDNNDLIPLVLLPAALARVGSGRPPSVRVLREWAADLKFPATRLANGKWVWSGADLPRIAAAVSTR
jgi:hypothetical protein